MTHSRHCSSANGRDLEETVQVRRASGPDPEPYAKPSNLPYLLFRLVVVIPRFITSICQIVVFINGWFLLQKIHPFVGGTPVMVHGIQEQSSP